MARLNRRPHRFKDPLRAIQSVLIKGGFQQLHLRNLRLRDQGELQSQQFAESPDLGAEVESASMDALYAHTAMSTQALEPKSVQREMVNILLNCSHLYEDLRARASAM
jgi:hypothetical protein